MSSRGTEMADVLSAIMASRRLRSQKALAVLVGMSEPQISGLYSGKRRLTDETCALFIEKFPDFKDRLRGVLEAEGRVEPASLDLQKAEALVKRGRGREAEATLERLLGQQGVPPRVVAEGALALARLVVERDLARAESLLNIARRQFASLGDVASANECLELIVRHMVTRERFDDSLLVMRAALGEDVRNSVVWRRLGITQWYAGDLLGAYASLSVALDLGHPRLNVLHARGQVLAELGVADRAISELTEVLDGDRHSSMAKAYARSSRAWAYAVHGEVDRALSEFADAELVTPENAWLHYFRARCYDEMGDDPGAALVCFEAALVFDVPALNRPKRAHALIRVATLRAEQL